MFFFITVKYEAYCPNGIYSIGNNNSLSINVIKTCLPFFLTWRPQAISFFQFLSINKDMLLAYLDVYLLLIKLEKSTICIMELEKWKEKDVFCCR